MKTQVCQGDVMIESCSPTEVEGLKQTNPILALGEATGHHHRFDAVTGEKTPLGFFKEGENVGGVALASFVQILGEKPRDLVHEEHAPISFEPGTYRKVQQVEYSPEEIRRVAD